MMSALKSFLVAATVACVAFLPVSTAAATPALQQQPADLLAGQVRGICYSGFRTGQHPDRGSGAVNPTEAQILEDLNILARQGEFPLLRLYDAKANSELVLRLIRQHKLKLQVLLGAWLAGEVNNPGCPWGKPMSPEVLAANRKDNQAEVRDVIRLANEFPDIVVAVAVGNEVLVDWNDHMVPLEALIRYVRQVKKAVPQPVTVCDNYAWWAKHGTALARELDFVSVHTYPVWEEKDLDEAMPFMIANLQAVRETLPDSRLVITEAGWATTAREFGHRADEARQKRYYHDLYEWARRMNITTFFFEAFDEDWKGDDHPLGAEKHWGLFTVDRKAKAAMHELYPDLKP